MAFGWSGRLGNGVDGGMMFCHDMVRNHDQFRDKMIASIGMRGLYLHSRRLLATKFKLGHYISNDGSLS